MEVSLLQTAPHEMSLAVGGAPIAQVSISATKCLRSTRFSLYVTDPTNELLRTDPAKLRVAAQSFFTYLLHGNDFTCGAQYVHKTRGKCGFVTAHPFDGAYLIMEDADGEFFGCEADELTKVETTC